jgi:hypothetical protein
MKHSLWSLLITLSFREIFYAKMSKVHLLRHIATQFLIKLQVFQEFLITLGLFIPWKVSCYKAGYHPTPSSWYHWKWGKIASLWRADRSLDRLKHTPCILQQQFSHIHILSECVKYLFITVHKFRTCGVSPDSILTDIILIL